MTKDQLRYLYDIEANHDSICEVCHDEVEVGDYEISHFRNNPDSLTPVKYFREICDSCMLEIAVI